MSNPVRFGKARPMGIPTPPPNGIPIDHECEHCQELVAVDWATTACSECGKPVDGREIMSNYGERQEQARIADFYGA